MPLTFLLDENASGKILITNDRESLAAHLADHLNAGAHSPGIFQLRRRRTISEVLEFLATVAYASDPSEWRDRIEYIP